MPPCRQSPIAEGLPGPYRSTACHIGTHSDCVESPPAPAPTDLPVIYEACDCLCHRAVDLPAPVGVTR